MQTRDKNRSASGPMSKEFLESARTYLSEAFPNPDRAGCPPDSALCSLAFNPRDSDPTITDHIGTCSPCFRRYSELLAELKAQRELEAPPLTRAIAWWKAHPLLAGTALVCVVLLLIGVGLLLRGTRHLNVPPMETHKEPPPKQTPPTVAYVPFSLDLSALSPVRGGEGPHTGHRRLSVPASTLDLTMTLPLASAEGPYDLMLNSQAHTLWSKSATAHLQKGKTLIRVEADFRKIPSGDYNLEVRSHSGIHLIQPVSLQPGLFSGGEQRP
jgi:hypothetical protein